MHADLVHQRQHIVIRPHPQLLLDPGRLWMGEKISFMQELDVYAYEILIVNTFHYSNSFPVVSSHQKEVGVSLS